MATHFLTRKLLGRFSTSAKAVRPLPPGAWAWRDIVYFPSKSGAHAKHRLDVFVSSASDSYPRSPVPVVLFVHGGSWVRGDRQYGIRPLLYDNVGGACARSNLIGCVMSYRLSPEVRHPEHARDVARALAWVRRNIHRYGGDPDRVVLCGHSAGAHLCASVLSDPTLMGDEGLAWGEEQEEAPSFVRGFVGISGVFNLERLARFPISASLLAPVFGSQPQDIQRASPVHLVAQAPPKKSLLIERLPLLLLTAEVDFHLRQDALELLRVLAARQPRGTSVVRQTAVIPKTNHVTIITQLGNGQAGAEEPVWDLVDRFLADQVTAAVAK